MIPAFSLIAVGIAKFCREVHIHDISLLSSGFAALVGNCSIAQLNTGTITGTVTDPSAALVRDVKVTVRNTATNAVRDTSTSGAGIYTVSDLIVGPYEVTFEAPAFKKLVRTGITLDVTQVVRVDARMEVGAVTESVQVTGQLP
jgi:hypothetical protein